MIHFFTKTEYLAEVPQVRQGPAQKTLPTIDDLVSLFESLDTNQNGSLSPGDMRIFIENLKVLRGNNTNQPL